MLKLSIIFFSGNAIYLRHARRKIPTTWLNRYVAIVAYSLHEVVTGDESLVEKPTTGHVTIQRPCFFAICEKPERGGYPPPPPGRARVEERDGVGPGRVGTGHKYSDFSLEYERTRSARCACSLVLNK